MKVFTLAQDHITLLQRANWGWWDCETGAPAMDCKRPYGNSYVPGDIAELLGWSRDKDGELSEAQEDIAYRIHAELQTALEVILSLKTFEPGVYEKGGESWERGKWVKRP